jgi:lipopolysaccharide/colanic/teichoic acid biosynthesis glycosyltransferase
MASRPIDLAIASVAAIPVMLICLLAGAGVWLADGTPILYRPRRVGRGGRVFTMYKLRTMRATVTPGPPITASRDDRVFVFGAWLRRSKIDELPQLVNVLRGDMSLVGPRPEDPVIVDGWYGPVARETLDVLPGLASPGSIYNFTHGEQQLGSGDVQDCYLRYLLPRKVALDLVYAREASALYDLRILGRAAAAILARCFGRRIFPDPPELAKSVRLEASIQMDINRTAAVSRRRA